MRMLLLLGLLTLFVSSCEDTKKKTFQDTKTTPKTEATQPANKIDTTATKKSKKTEPAYEKITSANAVAFFTEYGKNNPEVNVQLTTRFGVIHILLYEDTPLHRANFIYLVKQGYFSNTFFHRVVPNFIIQGGNSDLVSTNKKRNQLGSNYLLPAEINGRNHSYGSVSGAKEYRENPDKQTMPYEFFIFLGPQSSTSHLNGNYTVFGKVTKGMDVVEKISKLEKDEGEWPLQNVYITAEVL